MNAPIIPIPRSPVTVRVATPADLPFIDSLQKRHSKQVGWMPMKSLEGKVSAGEVLIAEEVTGHSSLVTCGRLPEREGPASDKGQVTSDTDVRVGYVIAADRYMKRDDVGIIYQMNVVPTHQRGLIGATLLRAQFERSAYGCRLYCCWCAQDLAANRFWEAMGFVPLAFRAGSRDKGRVHIFWQRRIRAGDATTPWWYPSKTNGGSIREDRIVLPIPPGTHWSEVRAMILPGMESSEVGGQRSGQKALPAPARRAKPKPIAKRNPVARNGMWFDVPKQPEKVATAKAPKEKRPKATHDRRLIAAARELRDRYLEHVNGQVLAREGKYDVSRTIDDATPPRAVALPVRGPAALPAPVATVADVAA
jgi:hypothetical protein